MSWKKNLGLAAVVAIMAVGYTSVARAQLCIQPVNAFCNVWEMFIHDAGPGPFADLTLREVGCETIPLPGHGALEIDGEILGVSFSTYIPGLSGEWACQLDLATLTGAGSVWAQDGAGGFFTFGDCAIFPCSPGAKSGPSWAD
jgi:hypothetical protein